MRSTTCAPLSMLAILVGTLCSLIGCSAVTFPIKGTPACCLPVDCLVYPKRNLVPIDYAKLAQPQPEVYRLDKGDVIGVFVQGILPYQETDQPPVLPPVQYRENRMAGASIPPAVGFPVAVQENGEITLPAIGRIQVVGDSLQEVSDKIQDKCVEQKLDRDKDPVCIVTLINPRTYNITVIREDQAGNPQEHASNGSVIQLPAYRNDVLNALMATGGMPGLLAKNEIRIRRSRSTRPQFGKTSTNPMDEPDDADDGDISKPDRASRKGSINADSEREDQSSINAEEVGANGHDSALNQPTYLADFIAESVIPLRIPQNTELEIRPEEVILNEGDIVYISNRSTEVFYTGGLLPAGEHQLPRDYDIDVFEAMAIAGYGYGSKSQGGGGGGMGGFGGLATMTGIIPTQLFIMRKRSDGTQYTIEVDVRKAVNNECERILIAPGDKLMLRYKPREELANFGVFAFFTFGISQLLRNN